MDSQLEQLVRRIAELLVRHGLYLATAESCTGGGVAQVLTAIPGSSQWFERGFVTYSNRSKEEMLGVSDECLLLHGAVSEQTVSAMAEGALRHSHAQISLAITGIAGPGGAVLDKPVGTVWLAWAALGRQTRCQLEHFHGNREQVRNQATMAALQGVLDVVDDW